MKLNMELMAEINKKNKELSDSLICKTGGCFSDPYSRRPSKEIQDFVTDMVRWMNKSESASFGISNNKYTPLDF